MYLNIGLIGNPLSHTFSPTIHTHYLDACKLNGGYICFDEPNVENLAQLTNILNKYNFTGVNVTVPYKVDIMSVCTSLDNTAKIANAVNTLHFKDDDIIGYNTDTFGVTKLFETNGISTTGANVLILGAGGATGAVIAHLLSHKPSKLTMANRTVANAKELANKFNIDVDVCSLDDVSGNEYDIVINCTSLGLHGEPFPNYEIGCKIACVDLQYQSDITPFLSLYKDSGVKLINGFAMLVYQAYQSFNIWTGCEFEPDIQKLNKFYYKHIGKDNETI